MRPEEDIGRVVDIGRARLENVLRNVELDETEGNHDGRNEERLGRVQKRGTEGLGEKVEAEADHDDGHDEEDDVDHHEGIADRRQPVEAEGHCRRKRGQSRGLLLTNFRSLIDERVRRTLVNDIGHASRCHVQTKICPCKVLDALLPRKLSPLLDT